MGAGEKLAEKLKGKLSQLALYGRSQIVDEYGLDPVFAKRIEPILDFFYDTWWRVSVHGVDHVPSKGRALLVANHSGALPYDGMMIMRAVAREQEKGRQVRFLAENFTYDFPFLGLMLQSVGAVRAAPENALRLLREDELVCVFPEGVKGIGKLFKDRYQLQRFGRGGFIRICMQTRAPIIPVAVVGAEEIHPMISGARFLSEPLGIPYLPVTWTFPWLGPLGMVPLPSKWSIEFGEPIPFDGYSAKDADNRLLVNRLAHEVRAEMQKMINKRIAGRKSVWRG